MRGAFWDILGVRILGMEMSGGEEMTEVGGDKA